MNHNDAAGAVVRPRLRRPAPLLSGVLLLVAAQASGAQELRPAPADTVRLSLADAVSRAVEQSEEIRLARAAVDLADAQVTAARAQALPQIDGTFNYTRTFASQFDDAGSPTIPDSLRFEPDPTASIEERIAYLEQNAENAALGALGSLFGNLPFGRENAYTAALSGSQPIYSGGRVGAALRIASEFRETARLGLQEERAEIELQIRNAYYRALFAGELEAIALAAVAQAESFRSQEELRLRTGTASELDLLRAEVELENLRPQLVEAQNAAQLAMLDLKRLADIPLTQPVRLTTPLVVPSAEELAAAPVSAELLTAQRAAVRAAERQVEIREQQVRIARGAFLPSVSVSMNYGKVLFPTSATDLTGRWATDWTGTIGVQIPLFSGFRRAAELQQSQIQLQQQQLQLAQLRESVQLQYEQARGERERAAASIMARQRTVAQAQRVHDLTVLRYERGLATQLEVSDARLALLQARTNLAQALADFYTADASLARALVGTTGASIESGLVPARQPPAAPLTPVPGQPAPVPPASDPAPAPATPGGAPTTNDPAR